MFIGSFRAPWEASAAADNASIALLISIDAFMIAMVFIIFAYGTATLFIKRLHIAKENAFRWVRITSINQLKVIVGEMIVIILFVKFFEVILLSAKGLKFELLILPVTFRQKATIHSPSVSLRVPSLSLRSQDSVLSGPGQMRKKWLIIASKRSVICAFPTGS